jgi:SAM-dependent methyltransferase
MNGGAVSWDKYISKVWESDKSEVMPNTLELLDFDTEYIYTLIRKYKKINVIDIGPGNALPVKKFLSFLISKNVLRKYIAIDYSPEMLKIAENNLKEWFGRDFLFEAHRADITSDTFQSLLFENSEFNCEDVTCANLILYIGGTIENDRLYDQQLRIINHSMGKSDTFVLEQGLDTESVKLRLTFGNQEDDSKSSDLKHRKMVLDLLNIPEDYYEIERFYDESSRAKLIKVKFNVDLKVKIETETFTKILSFSSQDSVVIWRYNSHTKMEVIDEMSKAGFDIKHVSTSMNNESIMLVSQIRSMNG